MSSMLNLKSETKLIKFLLLSRDLLLNAKQDAYFPAIKNKTKCIEFVNLYACIQLQNRH